jgi:hypothetical protein
MSILPLNTILQSRSQSISQSARLRRVSGAASPYQLLAERRLADDFAAASVYTRNRDNRPEFRLNFSGQLLQLGLKHNVDGLVLKAQEQLTYDGARPQSPYNAASRHYEKAQDNFARDTIGIVYHTY